MTSMWVLWKLIQEHSLTRSVNTSLLARCWTVSPGSFKSCRRRFPTRRTEIERDFICETPCKTSKCTPVFHLSFVWSLFGEFQKYYNLQSKYMHDQLLKEWWITWTVTMMRVDIAALGSVSLSSNAPFHVSIKSLRGTVFSIPLPPTHTRFQTITACSRRCANPLLPALEILTTPARKKCFH